MEILSTTEHLGIHIFSIVVLSLISTFLIGMVILVIADSIIEKEFGWNKFFMTIICSSLGVLTSYATIYGIKHGADITYKATVHDFNEVYNNGYKIIDQDGEIFILEKVGK